MLGRIGTTMLIVIDNYDSFTFNLYQYLGELGASMEVHRNDKISVDEIAERKPRGIVISPGPGTPDDGGISLDTIARFTGSVPILGVCLGHQCIGQHFGGVIRRADREGLALVDIADGQLMSAFGELWTKVKDQSAMKES